MPIRINEQMPVVKRLEEEQIFVMHHQSLIDSIY